MNRNDIHFWCSFMYIGPRVENVLKSNSATMWDILISIFSWKIECLHGHMSSYRLLPQKSIPIKRFSLEMLLENDAIWGQIYDMSTFMNIRKKEKYFVYYHYIHESVTLKSSILYICVTSESKITWNVFRENEWKILRKT